MPNFRNSFPSKYLSAADLDGTEPIVTIKNVKAEAIGDDQKLVVYFVGKEKGCVLNKTNANSIADIAKSDDTDDWTGKKLRLITVKVEFQGKRVPAIRIEDPKVTGTPKRAPEVSGDADDLEPPSTDEIQW